MPKSHPLTYEEVSEALAYDPETGVLTWKIRPTRRIPAGTEAGMVKNARANGRPDKLYRYITFNGYSTTAARFAWLLAYKEWPANSLLFRDGDTLNTRLANMKLGNFCYGASEGDLKQKKMTREASRHYGLKRYYGLTLEEYGQMLADQCGVCAICGKPEVRVTPKGDLTTLHVDHDHETGKVRSLLCYRCNSALGSMRDRPDLLRKAADYIERHRASRET